MNEDKDCMKIVITGKKSPKYYFQSVLYDTIIEGKHRVILSTIDKHRHIVERFLLPLLEMNFWEIDEDFHTNQEVKPIEEQWKGTNRIVTNLLYYLKRSPTSKGLIEEKLRNKKVKEAMLLLLNRMDTHRKELNDDEIIETMSMLLEFFAKKREKK